MSDFLREWQEVMFRIGRKETALFEKDNIAYTNSIFLSKARIMLMDWIYKYVCKFRGIPKIEDLSLEQKADLWAFVKDICQGREVDQQRMIEIARVFYTLEYFLNENKL